MDASRCTQIQDAQYMSWIQPSQIRINIQLQPFNQL